MPKSPPPPPGEVVEEAAEPVFDLAPKSEPDARVGTTDEAGRSEDEGKGRVFPCPSCGADLVFHIGQQALKCQYCGYEEAIVLPADVEVKERDLDAMIKSLQEHHDKGRNSFEGMKELRCGSCGGTVVFQDTLTSTDCPYCASPIQLDKAVVAKDRIAVDGVLPFLVDHDKAAKSLADWVKSRWFAPNDFLSQGIRADFNGVYLPYWTFDAMTFTRYSGWRGENYTVTVGTGKNRRTETRTRWYPASGSFQRFFDDVLVVASRGLNEDCIHELEPWPLPKVATYNQQMIAGFLARTYDIDLPQGFEAGRKRIHAALEADVRRRIGGDKQRIDKMDVRHSAVTFKHLLLPVWMMAYRYHAHPYRLYVNACTGEVQGERPYSWIKITLAVILGLIVAGLMYLFFNSR
jgi:DNA-directed RNA polymerase subunit RPC12/RpoP